MNDGALTASVVIPTYNRRAALPTILAPVLGDPACSEVIVVVDGDEDGSSVVLRALAEQDRRLVPLVISNSGEGAARMYGVERAKGDVVVLLDDDVLAEPGLIERHLTRHRERVADVVVGYMPVRIPQQARGMGPTRLYAEEYERHCQQYEHDPSRVLTTLWAGNMSLRRQTCLDIGLSSDSYRERYHPDRDFGLRCLRQGLTGTFDRSLRATHLHHRTLEAFIMDALSQGTGTRLLHELYPDLIGPFDQSHFYRRRTPITARAMLAAGRSRPLVNCVTPLLTKAIKVASAFDKTTIETRLLRALRRMLQEHGARSG